MKQLLLNFLLRIAGRLGHTWVSTEERFDLSRIHLETANMLAIARLEIQRLEDAVQTKNLQTIVITNIKQDITKTETVLRDLINGIERTAPRHASFIELERAKALLSKGTN